MNPTIRITEPDIIKEKKMCKTLIIIDNNQYQHQKFELLNPISYKKKKCVKH